MNTDFEMLVYIVALAGGALILAVILLYLQDRYRARRGVANSDRDFAERKGMAAWQAFLPGILALGSLFNLFAAEHWPQRLGWVVFTTLLLWYAVANWRAYSRVKQ